MNYSKIYLDFINSRIVRELSPGVYYESHHILPRSAGGDDSDDNLINLTIREHVFAHLLLTKIVDPLYKNAVFSVIAFWEGAPSSSSRLAYRKQNKIPRWILRRKSIRGNELLRILKQRNGRRYYD